jgi:tRNA-splicing ligase RtcB
MAVKLRNDRFPGRLPPGEKEQCTMTVCKGLSRVSETIWEIPPSYKKGMRVPARIYATDKLVRQLDDGVIDQITNVATLPGILHRALCMPDGHWGYGFPIGGVAAMDPE